MEYSPVRIKSTYRYHSTKRKNYAVTCHNHRVLTTVTATSSVVRDWVYKIRHRHRYRLRDSRLVVGLGVQWRPDYISSAATLQLCVGHQCLIFQLLRAVRCPVVLRRFLTDDRVKFVGIWNYKDSRVLKDSKHRIQVSGLLDVRHAANVVRGYDKRMSMERLASELLEMDGMRKDERVGRSEWDSKRLSEEQVKYACIDAFLCFLMGKELRVWNLDAVD